MFAVTVHELGDVELGIWPLATSFCPAGHGIRSKGALVYTAADKSWVVTPDETEQFNGPAGDGSMGIATLYFVKKNTNVNASQFEGFRFKFVIRAQ